MMVAARVAFGRKNSSGVRNSVASAMPTAVKAPAAGVSAPASKFTTERAKPPVTGNPPEMAAPMFDGAERDQLLVGVDALAALGGERQGDRDRLHVADDRDQQRGDEDLRPERRIERRQGDPGQALRDLADDADAARGEPEAPDRQGRRDDGHGGADLREDVRGRARRAPRRRRRGLRPPRTQKRKASDARPIAAVCGLMSPRLGTIESTRSTKVSPSRWMPRTGASWPAAIWRPDAVMNPEMTGWLRKFARNPSRSSPMASSSSPETRASAMAAPRYSGVPWDASGLTAAAVMRLATATGPTASVREVPKTA